MKGPSVITKPSRNPSKTSCTAKTGRSLTWTTNFPDSKVRWMTKRNKLSNSRNESGISKKKLPGNQFVHGLLPRSRVPTGQTMKNLRNFKRNWRRQKRRATRQKRTTKLWKRKLKKWLEQMRTIKSVLLRRNWKSSVSKKECLQFKLRNLRCLRKRKRRRSKGHQALHLQVPQGRGARGGRRG